MNKICFVISPMGDTNSPTRIRANYVFQTYIKPACLKTGYQAVRAEHQEVQNIVEGITTSLQNAPLAIAFLGFPVGDASGCGGASFWNANVMIEIGYRTASRLSLILISDRDGTGKKPEYPLSLSTLRIMLLPGPGNGPTPHDWVDSAPGETSEELVGMIKAEEKRVRLLDCKHPMASINASHRDTEDPEDLLYTAASLAAEKLFGIAINEKERPKLVGRTMAQYLDGVKERMHPIQWKMFQRDQVQARESLKNNQASVANIPIVFENHNDDRLNRRAYLPIIVQEFQPNKEGENNWYNLRVCYLNVTTVTDKACLPNGDEYYVCRLDPTSDKTLEPLRAFAGIKAFLSYSRRNYEKVEPILELLKGLVPYVDPFIDLGIGAGEPDIPQLQEALDKAKIFFVFIDSQPSGPGQDAEVQDILGRRLAGGTQVVVPVLIGDAKLPPFLRRYEWVKYDNLDLPKILQILSHHFNDRCPDEWAEIEPVVKKALAAVVPAA